MAISNIEFKAATADLETQERMLQNLNPVFIGEDHQLDTYFHVPFGRLKLREGNIENALIQYERINLAGSKLSQVLLYQHQPGSALKEILVKSLGVKTVVDKMRRIYFIENVKFHFDTVKNLGTFIEVEAIDTTGAIGERKLKEQCNYYQSMFKIADKDFIALSYSDLLLAQL